jgi:hypothetical protein
MEASHIEASHGDPPPPPPPTLETSHTVFDSARPEQPRTQALSTIRSSLEERPSVQADHASPRFWEITKFCIRMGANFVLAISIR